MRVALITNFISPYRLPVFRRLAETPDWDFKVFVSDETEFDRTWNVDPRDLPWEKISGRSFKRHIATRGEVKVAQHVTLHLPFGLPSALRRFHPDVVISGELGLRTLLALAYCRCAGIPCIIWSYNSRTSVTSAGRWHQRIRRLMLRSADAVVGMGVQAREVLRRFGVPDAKIFNAVNAHDHDMCHAAWKASDPYAMRHELRNRHHCRDNIAIVSGRLIPVKGIDALLAAWNRLSFDLRQRWTLLFVGDGPLKDLIRSAGRQHAPGEIVQLDERQPAEVVPYYAASDLLIFASLADNWGLVVNEAMVCGLPVMCSRLAGCADDMIQEGRNGWLFDPTQPDDFDRVLATALMHGRTPAMARCAQETALRFTPDIMAEGFRRAVHAATAGRCTDNEYIPDRCKTTAVAAANGRRGDPI